VSARAELEQAVLVVACAVSAGVHAALVPDHLADGALAALGFAAAAAALAGLVVALTARPAGTLPVAAAALLLGGLVAAWGLAVSTGIPLVHPDPEPVDVLGVATKAVEAAGLAAAALLLRQTRLSTTSSDPEGALA
jgi:hypothetical protein